MTKWRLVVGAVALIASISGCGGADAPPVGVDLSEAGLKGRSTALAAGCTSCHGRDGEGGVGPPWIDMAGSVRPLVDGSGVSADRAYLTRAIVDPPAERVAGYTITMPTVDLTETQVAAIVDYIEELS